MIKQVRLEREYFGRIETEESRPAYWYLRVVVSPSWVSNGHWAIHKNLVTNADDFKDEETIRKYFQLTDNDELIFLEFDDEKIKVLFPDIRIRFVIDGSVRLAGKPYAKFTDYGNGLAYFNMEYIKLFKITELWGESLNSYVNMAKGKPTFVIMPCKL